MPRNKKRLKKKARRSSLQFRSEKIQPSKPESVRLVMCGSERGRATKYTTHTKNIGGIQGAMLAAIRAIDQACKDGFYPELVTLERVSGISIRET